MSGAVARARGYLRALGPAVEGSGGDEKTYQAVRAMWGFALDEADAMRLLLEWNAGCRPPWTERELETKLSSCYRRTNIPRGYLLDDDAEPEPPREPKYPTDALAYFARCRPAIEDERALLWLASRGLTDRATLVQSYLATVLRVAAPGGPRWASSAGRPWAAGGHRLVIPVFDASGEVRGLRARWSVAEDDPIAGPTEARHVGPKTLPPTGFDTAGLVLANPAAVAVLSGVERAATVIWVAEGEPDWMTLTYQLARAGRRSEPVLGVFSGSWTWALVGRMMKTDTVIIATHDDLQGRKYAEEIQASLHGRVAHIRRHRPRAKKEG